MRTQRNVDTGGVVFGLIVLAVGLYYLGQNTFGLAMPKIDWDRLWPLLIVALGVWIVFSAWTRRRPGSSGP